jgi:hypothetical protein
VPVDGPDHTA